MEESFISRPYQVKLEEIASGKNTIIHLPTGSGKTHIAVSLIKRFGSQTLKPWSEGGKRTFFLVNTVPLVYQQMKYIKAQCPVSGVGAYSSEDGVDYWDKVKWDAELENNQVIVMTAQILCDMLTHSYIKIEDINLLIFDECHHAVDDHPMRLVMKHFELCPLHKQPRVLGLTATLLNANVSLNQVESTLRGLETTFQATIATVNELGEVLMYSTNPYETVRYYNKPQLSEAAQLAIKKLNYLQSLVLAVNLPNAKKTQEVFLKKHQHDITTDPKKIVKAVKNIIVSMVMFIMEMGCYGGAVGILAYIVLLERLKRKASTKEEEMLYKFTITHSLEARLILLTSMENDKGYQKIVKHSSEKILLLLDILKEYNPNVIKTPGVVLKTNHSKQALCALIFTQQRFTSKVIYNILKEVINENPKEFGFIKHDFIVGFSVNPMKCTREQHYLKKASHKALLMFRNNDLNCLISTSVIEEGVDMPNCLLVVRYDRPLEYRSYIQSKGRARSKDSSYVIMVDTQEASQVLKQLNNFQKIEAFIHRVLVGTTDDREAPTENDVQKNLYEEDELPNYYTKNGGCLPSVSAISLLNRYITMLPHDQFTIIAPAWIAENVFSNDEQRRLVSVMLPLACPVKEVIKGDPQKSLKNAKRSAALNACKKLHEIGELDDVTLLPKQYAKVDFEELDVKSCFPNWPWNGRPDENNKDAPKPGSKKCVRKHKIAFPKCLTATSTNKYYLHVIHLTTQFPEPSDSRKNALYKLLRDEAGFGFLTPHALPKLCAFPAFLTIGEVTTDIEMNYAVIELTPNLFDIIKRFHYFLFDQVLVVAKKFLVFEGKVNCMYVVPLKKDNGYDIDWDVMVTHKSIPPVQVPTDMERSNIKVTREEYMYKVISPWYRGTILPDRYIVSNIYEDKTPKSSFESSPFTTYADYYLSKYNLEICGQQDQSLLEVRNITSRMNCLLPRGATIRTLTDKQKKLISASQGDEKPDKYEEVFIAEFCIKYDFPSVLWLKAMILPSIIHRVHMLLVSHELIAEVAKDIKFGTTLLKKGEEWLPVPLEMEVATKSLLSQIEEPRKPRDTIERMETDSEIEMPAFPFKSMRDSLYQLQKKKINKEYPWEEQSEPIDIERNLTSVTVMDIECYDEFVSAPMNASEESVKSPVRTMPVGAAIKAPPIQYVDKIDILTRKPVGRGPELRDVLRSLTTSKSHEAFSLERFETLGDSFLKFAATLYLYHKFPGRNEGQLTNIKGRLISNRNLYYAGERINLGGRMKVEQFSPRKDFMVPGFFAPIQLEEFIRSKQIRPTFLIDVRLSEEETLSGALKPDTYKEITRRFNSGESIIEEEPLGEAENAMQCYLHSQAVSDKCVADSVEALIGTYLVSGGILGAIKFVEWMNIIPKEDNFASYLNKKVPTVISDGKAKPEDINFLLDGYQKSIENILNYKFKDPAYLLEAMSHSSYIRNRLTRSYERMEFLGDAILDFLITSHIFENCPNLQPGDITNLRSALVNNVTFASYVVKLGLYKFVCKEINPGLDRAVNEFVEHQVERNHEIVEEVLYLINEEECHVAEYIEVPKMLSDIFEALTGAIYLDSGGDLQTVWSVIYPIMGKEIYNFSQRIPKQPVVVLYENKHAGALFGTPRVIDENIMKVMIPVTFTKEGSQYTVYGVGKNKFQAKRAAAKFALKILDH